MTFPDVNSGWSMWDIPRIEGFCNVRGRNDNQKQGKAMDL